LSQGKSSRIEKIGGSGQGREHHQTKGSLKQFRRAFSFPQEKREERTAARVGAGAPIHIFSGGGGKKKDDRCKPFSRVVASDEARQKGERESLDKRVRTRSGDLRKPLDTGQQRKRRG